MSSSTSGPTRNLSASSKPSSGSALPSKLASILTSSLPASSPGFQIHHVSHSPVRCEPLYSAPHGKKPEKTNLTSHFLAVSSVSTGILIYAIEVHIYNTRTRTTLFVSKADSTGFFPKSSTPAARNLISPVRAITTAFLRYLLDDTKRDGVTQHLTLFARAQDQYLFPNSVRNKGKHVLSDIQLIRWWAKVLDPIVAGESEESREGQSKGYILVPGLDRVDLRNVFPNSKWIHGHPYSLPNKPTRECIPHFEDDPKSRFMDELEEQGWKGVRSMKEFWELMAFRQECSLGKSVGFLSVVFEPPTSPKSPITGSQTSRNSNGDAREIQDQNDERSRPGSRKRRSPEADSSNGSPKRTKTKLPISDISSASTYTIASLLRNPETRGIICRQSSRLSRSSSYASNTKGNDGDANGSSGRVLTKKDFDRLMASLLDSDFEGRKCALESSVVWIKMAGSETLYTLQPSDLDPTQIDAVEGAKVNVLEVKKKNPKEALTTNNEPVSVNVLQARKRETHEVDTQPSINVLIPRKKDLEKQEAEENPTREPSINVLQVRKKAKNPTPEPVINILQPRKKQKPTQE